MKREDNEPKWQYGTLFRFLEKHISVLPVGINADFIQRNY